jgi:hypothetical protein
VDAALVDTHVPVGAHEIDAVLEAERFVVAADTSAVTRQSRRRKLSAICNDLCVVRPRLPDIHRTTIASPKE